jgi:tetratricopeptide (TPR) repeat protein
LKYCYGKAGLLIAVLFLTAGFRGGFVDTFAAQSPPAQAAALLAAAQHQFGAGNYASAIATLRIVISQDPPGAEAFYWLGRCYYEIGDVDNAIVHIEKAVSLQPKNSMYQQWLGRAYGAKADREKSFFMARKVKKQFEQAVQLDPTNIAARRDLEDFCMLAPWIVGGNNDEARAQADAIEQIDAVEGHLAHAAFNAQALKRGDLAENEYMQVLAAKPSKVDPILEAANFFLAQNKLTETNSAIEAAGRTNPNDPRLDYYRDGGRAARPRRGIFEVLSGQHSRSK